MLAKMQNTQICQCETRGEMILGSNDFFKNLCSIMRNKEFKQFYDEYFHSWNDIECMIFYMKLYKTIEYEYKERYKCNISDELMTFMLHQIMSNAETRKTALSLFKRYEEDVTITQSKPLRSLLKFANE